MGFVKGLRTFGKNFFKIREEFLRNNDTNDLVEFYYLWKKTPEGLQNRQQRSMRGKKPAPNVSNKNGPGLGIGGNRGTLYPNNGRDSPGPNKSDVNIDSDDEDSGHKENEKNEKTKKPVPPPITMSSSEDEKTVNFKKYAWLIENRSQNRPPRRRKPQFGRRIRNETDSGELVEKRSKLVDVSDSDEEMENDKRKRNNKRRRIAREKRRERRSRTQGESDSEESESDD